MTLLEPDVALTDFALALECGGFAAWLFRARDASRPGALPFVLFFAATGLAALLGGIFHGFLSDPHSNPARAVWTATMITIGAAALSCWLAAARLCLSEAGAALLIRFAAALFVIYIAAVLFISDSFRVAVVHYLPAAAFLLLAFILAYRRRRDGFLLAGAAGVLLAFVAAGIQQYGLNLHPLYFNHNAFYHLVQAAALLLIFVAARGVITRRAM